MRNKVKEISRSILQAIKEDFITVNEWYQIVQIVQEKVTKDD